jgi:hypothetical protein
VSILFSYSDCFVTDGRSESGISAWSTEEEIFSAVVKGDIDATLRLLDSGVDPSLQDSEVGSISSSPTYLLIDLSCISLSLLPPLFPSS